MRTTKTLLLGTLCLSTILGGCVDEPSVSENDDTEEGLADDLIETPFCLATALPAPFDRTVDLDDLTGDRLYLMNDYGTTSCSNYTTKFVHYGNWYLATAISTPTTAQECVGTKLTVLVDEEDSGWTRTTHVLYGEWTASGCVLPELEGGMFGIDEARVTAKLQQTTCAGQLCGTQYGRPFFIIARP